MLLLILFSTFDVVLIESSWSKIYFVEFSKADKELSDLNIFFISIS
jgi:hypothetical protein